MQYVQDCILLVSYIIIINTTRSYQRHDITNPKACQKALFAACIRGREMVTGIPRRPPGRLFSLQAKAGSLRPPPAAVPKTPSPPSRPRRPQSPRAAAAMSQSLANMIVDNNTHFFEGVEKLLEVWFTRKDGLTSNCDLRKVPRSRLEEVMQTVKCEIISMTSTDELDAYVLSESSMFISARRFILKTCGTTTPLCCLPLLMSLVKEYAGYDTVQDLYYTRKNFKRPELQVSPHRTFEEEVSILDQMYPGGRAYCMGSVNRPDCWYLYTVSPGRSRYHPNAARQNLPHNRLGKAHREPDQTLEVLMMNLDPEKMKWFYKEVCPTAAEATKKSGIDRLIPDVMIDDFQFDPCGYSMNGLMRSVPGGYMTIHITPEPEFSYVSFETNIPQKSYKDLISRVVSTFGPQQFVLTFFKSLENGASIGVEEDNYSVPQYSDYDVDDVQICRLQGYDLTYALYNRFPS